MFILFLSIILDDLDDLSKLDDLVDLDDLSDLQKKYLAVHPRDSVDLMQSNRIALGGGLSITLHICDMNFKPCHWVARHGLGRGHCFLSGAEGATFTASPSATPSGGLSITRSETSKPEDNSTLLP